MNKEIAQALLNYRRAQRDYDQAWETYSSFQPENGYDRRTKGAKEKERLEQLWSKASGVLQETRTAFYTLVMEPLYKYTDADLERIVNPPSLFPETFSITPVFKIYTDGGCRPNPGRGACAYLVIDLVTGIKYDNVEVWLNVTNNQMELRAVINALESLKEPAKVSLFTDSEYVKMGITQWIDRWDKNGWKTATGDPVKNKYLWTLLKKYAQQHEIEWHWVKGHNENEYNERCDQLCTEALNADSTG